MAEILISLTIIGVIAAIIIPSLHANIEKKAWATKKKALYSRLSQAVDMMPKLNGYGTYSASYDESGSLNITADTAAMAFVTDGLQQTLRINNICDSDNLIKCGISSTIKNTSGGNVTFPTKLSELDPGFSYSANPLAYVDTKVAAFETVNGESVAVFYNPYCQYETPLVGLYYVAPKMCVNFVYDVNGKTKPNKFGEDIGAVSVLFSENPVLVSPKQLIIDGNTTVESFSELNTRCAAYGDYRTPRRYELMSSLVYNSKFIAQKVGKGAFAYGAYHLYENGILYAFNYVGNAQVISGYGGFQRQIYSTRICIEK